MNRPPDGRVKREPMDHHGEQQQQHMQRRGPGNDPSEPPSKKMNMVHGHDGGDSGSETHQSQQGTPGGGHDSMQVGAGAPLVVRVMVPAGVVGNVIGKKGDTLRNIRADTSCTLRMSRNEEGTYPGTKERVLQVRGTLSGVQQAIMMIRDKVNEKLDPSKLETDPFDHHGVHRKSEVKLVVPNTSAGVVIGKSGSSIREIREATASNIQVYPKAGSAEATRSAERIITISAAGDLELCQAVARVLEKIASDPGHASGPETFNPSSVALSTPLGGGGGARPPTPVHVHSGGVHVQSDDTAAMNVLQQQMDAARHAQGGVQHSQGYRGHSALEPRQRCAYETNSLGGTPAASKQSNGGIKFNPLEGVSNMEVLAFLDSLQSTLRQSGFTEQAVAEIMQAMQVLAKYNIMGLGLGLGVAAMAQMRGSQAPLQQSMAQQVNEQPVSYAAPPPASTVQHSAPAQAPAVPVNNLSAAQQQLEAISKYGQLTAAQQQAVATLLSAPNQSVGISEPSPPQQQQQQQQQQMQQFITSVPPPPVSQPHNMPAVSQGNGSVAAVSSVHSAANLNEDIKMHDMQGQIASWAGAVPTTKTRVQLDPNKLEMEVNDMLVPNADTLSSVQRFSGCVIDTSRRSGTDPNARIIAIQGEADSVRAAKLMIERIVADESDRRQQQQHAIY